MPASIVKIQQERSKSMTFKFEALQLFVKLWKGLAHRLRSIVLGQNRIAVCEFLGTFAPINLLKFSDVANNISIVENKFKTCYVPS